MASMAAIPGMVPAQRAEYSITVIPPGKGPYTFPVGYQTPWDKIQIRVTERMSPRQGAVIYSQENLRHELLRPPPRANGQPAPAPDMAGIPVGTYKYNPAAPGQPAVTFNMNGETVDVIPMMPSHTAGDTIVRFRQANAIYIEDFYRNFGYPFADQANGGSIQGMLEAVDLIETLAGPDTTLISRAWHAGQQERSPGVSRHAQTSLGGAPMGWPIHSRCTVQTVRGWLDLTTLMVVRAAARVSRDGRRRLIIGIGRRTLRADRTCSEML
jgi:hypothetical protein